MDWLLDVKDAVEKEVFTQVAGLLNLEVDLLFLDTASTCFQVGDEDEPVARDEHGSPVPRAAAAGAGEGSGQAAGEGHDGGAGQKTTGFRVLGKSKDHRDDLPQIVWVADRGFTSAENRRCLRRGGCRYIIGEKLRSGSAEAAAALSRQGRYHEVAGNLRAREVRISDDERFVICHNPGGAERDAAIRARLTARLKDMIDGTGKLTATKRAELRGVISARPGLNRYLRVTPGGLLRTHAARVKAEENLDGKYLLRTSGPRLSAADIAAGCKQLLEVERGWRDMKQVPAPKARPQIHALARITTAERRASCDSSLLSMKAARSVTLPLKLARADGWHERRPGQSLGPEQQSPGRSDWQIMRRTIRRPDFDDARHPNSLP